MPPKKKLSKKEKARLEAERAELLRIEMEKEKLKKLEEERRRKEIEREQAKKRQQEEIVENKVRRQQLKQSMSFFDRVQKTIDAIRQTEREERDWEKFMRCNGLPNASIPSDLRKYIHQWLSDNERRRRRSRNWLLRTDERTLLTQDANVPDLSRATLKKKQGNLGDDYAKRIVEVLGILAELDEALLDKKRPTHTADDLLRLKSEIRVLLNEHLDEFTYRIMSHIERDMTIDRPGVSKQIYTSGVFKCHIWTFSKDAQLSLTPKARIGEQNLHNEIDFPVNEMHVTLPPTVQLRSAGLRGLWLNYDHFSDYCPSFNLKRPRPENMNILIQTKIEWRKRKEILQSMLDDCSRDSPSHLAALNQDHSTTSSQEAAGARGRNYDVDKIYTEYEDGLNKARRQAFGPEGFGLLETDVNLRKYRIIGGVYCIDYLETPEQDKRLNARSFIRTVVAPDCLTRKGFYQTYKPPPPVQPGVRRLPEEIEAEMRMIETALDKLALVTVQLPDTVIWFEPPIACRWETSQETLECDLTEGVKRPAAPTLSTATPTEATQTPRSSTTANLSPLKGSPRFPGRLRKRSRSKSSATTPAKPVREVTDFDVLNIPRGIDIHGLLKDFVVPRLPEGFRLRQTKEARGKKCTGVGGFAGEAGGLIGEGLTGEAAGLTGDIEGFTEAEASDEVSPRPPTVLFIAKHPNASLGRGGDGTQGCRPNADEDDEDDDGRLERISEEHLEHSEPREFFASVEFEKVLQLREDPRGRRLSSRRLMGTAGANGGGGGGGVVEMEDDDDDEKLARGEEGKKSVRIREAGGAEDRRSSGESVESGGGIGGRRGAGVGTDGDGNGGQAKRYLFSQLLEDLDRLCALQLPKLQEEALQQISENLSLSRSASTASQGAAVGTGAGGAETEAAEGEADKLMAAAAASSMSMTTSFPFLAGFSFVRDLAAAVEAPQPEEAEDLELEESSSEYSDEAYDEFEMEQELLEQGAFNVGAAPMVGGATGGGGGGGGGIHDFLSKHSQSEGGDSSDGRKTKMSNAAALTQGKWSTRDVHDTKFNEDKLSIQFRTGRLGIFGFALNRYSNMPYQTWEIKPDLKSPGTILFSFTASIVSLDMTITSGGYCVNSFQGGSTETINAMIGKTLSLAELKATLISSAVDVFPEEDAFCYTEGSCEKNYIMEMHLYACMSTLGLSHNFSWSRWNLLAGSRTAVLLIRELIEGKKVPNHSTLLVTPLKTAIIDCTEVSASFNAAGIPGMEYYADLYQLSQVHAQPSSLEKQRTMDPVLRDNVARILMAIRPISFC